MDRRTESAILDLALARGLVSSHDLDGTASADGATAKRWGERLGALIGERQLRESEVLALEREVLQSATAAADATVALAEGLGGAVSEATAPTTGARPPAAGSFGRYELLGLLGEGAMGRVFKAWDPALGRFVALKILFGDDPARVSRFLMEARAQARIDHPNVCPVHDVGNAEDGRPYIAMQLVSGRTLGEAAREMTLEQVVRTVQAVAEGVHAAHRTGLIHRDLKPSNVMVERTETGDFRPYVLDFGLARDLEGPGLTVTGATVGTPAYMSPEQAEGKAEKMDRRTDVYGLGATLYELLSGRPPFLGSSNLEIMLKVVQEDAVPLRRRKPSIPRDLETIAVRCLEKEPQRRYESARALAEDLGRFLDGEPVLARRAGYLYKLARKARKHRVVAGIVGAAFLAAVVGAGWGVNTRLNAAQATRLAREFGQEVERLDGILRFSALLPLHDTRPERALVRDRLKALEARIGRSGGAARGPGSEALGRGYLALGENERARQRLAEAWGEGYRTPELAYALGLAYGRRYTEELAAVERIRNKEARAARRQAIESAFLKPAVDFLRYSRGASALAPEYVEGLLAFFEKRPEEALARTREASRKVPWLYEAQLLTGTVLATMGTAKREAGDEPAALALYENADAVLREGARRAQSAPEIHVALCSLWQDVMTVELYGKGTGRFAPALDRSLSACTDALRADPELPSAFVLLSRTHTMQAEYAREHGQDPAPALAQARDAGEAAVRLAPDSAEAYRNLGIAYSYTAEVEIGTGRDPRPSLGAAIRCYEATLKKEPGSSPVLNNLGIAYMDRGEYESTQGADPRASLEAAARSFRGALERNPKNAMALYNMGISYRIRSDWESGHGLDPIPSLEEAIRAYSKVLEAMPEDPYTLNTLGFAHWARADFELTVGRDPRPSAGKAREALEKAARLKPDYALPRLNLGFVERVLAEYTLESGQDPSAAIEAGLKDFKTGLALSGSLPAPFVEQAALLLVRGRWERSRGRSPAPAVEGARQSLKRALSIDPAFSAAPKLEAEAELLLASWEEEAGRSVEAPTRRGLAAVERALKLRPFWPEALATKGTLELLLARHTRDAAAKEAAAREARDLLERALAGNAHLTRGYGPALEAARKAGNARGT